jgi:HPr kinase/phosphorylase
LKEAEADIPRLNLHGVALALGETGLLVLGDSGSGKSTLAASLLAGWPYGPARLVADDRVIVERRHGRLTARSHQQIAGQLECRGFGIVRPDSLDAVILRAAVTLTASPIERLPEPDKRRLVVLDIALPHCFLPADEDAAHRLFAVWPYFSELRGPF